MWAHLQLTAVLLNVIYLLDIDEFTIKEDQTQHICYGTDSSEGVIYSPGFTSSSTYTFTTSKVLNVTFCNLPTLYWLHLDYIEEVTTADKCFKKRNDLPYIISSGPGLLNNTESCSNSIYSWKTLQFNESSVKLTLSVATSPRSTFRIDYKGKCHVTLFVNQYVYMIWFLTILINFYVEFFFKLSMYKKLFCTSHFLCKRN